MLSRVSKLMPLPGYTSVTGCSCWGLRRHTAMRFKDWCKMSVWSLSHQWLSRSASKPIYCAALSQSSTCGAAYARTFIHQLQKKHARNRLSWRFAWKAFIERRKSTVGHDDFPLSKQKLISFCQFTSKTKWCWFFSPQIKQEITSMNSVSSAFYVFVTLVLKLPNFTKFIKV